jgi:hypothetical protein
MVKKPKKHKLTSKRQLFPTKYDLLQTVTTMTACIYLATYTIMRVAGYATQGMEDIGVVFFSLALEWAKKPNRM